MNAHMRRAETAAKEGIALFDRIKSEGRAPTPDEVIKFNDLKKAAQDALALGRQEDQIMADAKALTALVGAPHGVELHGGGDESRRVSRGGWAKHAAAAVTKALPGSPGGQKAVVSGSIGVGNVVEPGITDLPRVPQRILDLIRTDAAGSNGSGSNTFTYLQQTVRTNTANVVADGAVKPTSVYTIAEVEDRFRVIAHLSEAIPNRYFNDFAQLQDFLASEMEYGLLSKLEQQVLSGTGSGEQFTGILNTSGILSVAAVTGDLIATARKAQTALEASGITPNAFVLNPVDAERFDLIREGASSGQYLLGGPGTGSSRTLWSLPRVSSLSVPAGTAILADWSSAKLAVREGATLAIDSSGDNFTKNLSVMRLEGRFGLAVVRPVAFAKITLPA